MPPLLVRGRLTEDDDEAEDLAASNVEVVRQDQLFREVGLVELAVIGAAHDYRAIAIENFADLDGHMVADNFLLHPAPDRFGPDDLTPVVIDVCVRGKSCHDRRSE